MKNINDFIVPVISPVVAVNTILFNRDPYSKRKLALIETLTTEEKRKVRK